MSGEIKECDWCVIVVSKGRASLGAWGGSIDQMREIVENFKRSLPFSTETQFVLFAVPKGTVFAGSPAPQVIGVKRFKLFASGSV